MKTQPRAMIFSLVASLTYTLAYYFDWSRFQYYLAVNRFHFSPQGAEAGPPILWYGWLGTACLAGALPAFIVPQRPPPPLSSPLSSCPSASPRVCHPISYGWCLSSSSWRR